MTQLTSLAANALRAQESWNAKGLHARIALLKDSVNTNPLASWLLQTIADEMTEEVSLPGPTGESNTLLWKGRGVVAICSDASEESFLSDSITAHAIAALATGNTIIIQDSVPSAKALFTVLSNIVPQDVVAIADCSTTDFSTETIFAAYTYSGTAENETALNRLLSKRGGALAQLISETDMEHCTTQTSQDYPWRFITETTLTVNTTAVGGNATLLELGGNSDH